MILASQNPPKTLPKSYQNRNSKKHTIFHRFLLNVFLFFNIQFLENRGFPIGKSLILTFSPKSCFHKSNVFLFQKTYQKRFQNEVRTLPKSMPKTWCFLTSIFSGFGLDFGRSWACKSAALLAAPGVLNPTAFYACINILLFLA